MRIKRIKVKNFRSIDNEGIEIELPSNDLPFSIVGHNNSGKSNLISAILCAMGAKGNKEIDFDEHDFYMMDCTKDIFIEIEVEDPLKSSNAFNSITEMPIMRLTVKQEDGSFSKNHYFHDKDGRPIYNTPAVKRSSTKTYTEEEKALLNSVLKSGSEAVWKWKSKIPVYFINSTSIHDQLKLTRYSLLGKVMEEVKNEFESEENILNESPVPSHIGKSRKEVYDNGMDYLENYVLSTPKLDELIKNIEEVIKKQLEIEKENFSLKFGFISANSFFDNLKFYLSDHKDKPKLPIDQMGNGFISLFIVALFRAILKTDEVGGNIFIIEEPETFLHEHFQEYFYKILCQLSTNNQVIYTTHSKKFVNIFDPETIIKIKNIDFLKTEYIYKRTPSIGYQASEENPALSNPKDFAKYMKTLEPNLGNIIFASKVIIVEGPHDLLAYKTILGDKINFGLKNIAIVAAWGKDSILTIIQICKRYEIPYYVIHDWDLDDESIDISITPKESKIYQSLTPEDKAQYTKNYKIALEAGIENVHTNKRNIEEVLDIDVSDKGTLSIFEKINNKSFEDIQSSYPLLIDDGLLNFLEINT